MDRDDWDAYVSGPTRSDSVRSFPAIGANNQGSHHGQETQQAQAEQARQTLLSDKR